MIQKISYHIKNGGITELIKIAYRFLLIRTAPVLIKLFGLFGLKQQIVFSHFDGKAYGGNPGVICDSVLNCNLPYKAIWITDKCYKKEIPDGVKWVPTYSLRQLWALATSKVWIDDCRKSYCIRKKKNQYYIQTWHGGGPCLKKIEADAIDSLPKSYIRDAKNDSLMADLFLSSCKWRTENYKTAFWYNGEILKCGAPTEDIYAVNPKLVKENVYRYFGITSEKNIILYAPTFRYSRDLKPYELDFDKVLDITQKKFGGEWCLLIRLHPAMMDLSDSFHYSDTIVNGSMFPRFEDLVIASDMLITDYSGGMFSAYMLNKKVFIFAKDMRDYLSGERDCYFKMEDLPAPISTSSEGLVNCIQEFDQKSYEEKVNTLNCEIGYYSFGKATETIVERIIKVMEE